jgi:chromosome segregation ATPase
MSLRQLITSEFNDGQTPDELRDLLFEFRKEYRKLESNNIQLKRKIEYYENELDKLKNQLDDSKKENDKIRHKLSLYRKKKLSIRERITGKIKF